MTSKMSTLIWPDVDRESTATCHITSEPPVINAGRQTRSKRLTSRLLLSNRGEVMITTTGEICEANQQFIASSRRYCRDFDGAEVMDLPGLIAAWRNTPVPISNAIFLS